MPLRISLFLSCFVTFSIAALAANPVPFVNQPLLPATVAPGSGAFTLTVNGTGFVSTSVVKWNGSARNTTFVSSSELQAAISASDVATAGSAAITVNSGSADSNSVRLWIATSVQKIFFDMRYTGIQLASAPNNVISADFNGDGKADVALANGYSNPPELFPHQVGILFGKGDTTFQSFIDYPSAPQTNDLAAGDFNNDGIFDIAVAGATSETNPHNLGLSILLGNGDGTFQPALSIPTTADYPVRLLIADFNRDGNLDIATVQVNTSSVSTFLGNGDGSFQNPVVTTMSANYGFAVIGDFNRDGILDLAGPMAVSLGNGDGTFQPPTFPSPNNEPITIAVGDFDGDGILDLATTGYLAISVCLGNGDGTFQPGILSHEDTSNGFGQLLTLDLNGDGKLDLIETHTYGLRISYVLGNGDGTFQNFHFVNVPNPTKFVAADLNGDGRPDFIYIGGEAQYNDLGVYKLIQKEQ
jgi:hypothetical protein